MISEKIMANKIKKNKWLEAYKNMCCFFSGFIGKK